MDGSNVDIVKEATPIKTYLKRRNNGLKRGSKNREKAKMKKSVPVEISTIIDLHLKGITEKFNSFIFISVCVQDKIK